MSAARFARPGNRHKLIHDLIAVAAMLAVVAVSYAVARAAYAGAHAVSDGILLIRALGACGLLALHVVLCIGPLARLHTGFAPLLYNRRHLGVATFVVGLLHGVVALVVYHGAGSVNPLLSLLTRNTNFGSAAAFPYQLLGLAALAILGLLAATSHDFGLRRLGARAWKRVHMLVYLAYAFVVLHVALGPLQTQQNPWLTLILVAGIVLVGGLHIVAGVRDHVRDARGVEEPTRPGEKWLDAGAVDEIADGRGKPFCIAGRERIAIFRYGNHVSATTNVCVHQGGPLGEGRIIDGCITCPWHGWQYRPTDGQRPPPSAEKIATYRVRIVRRRVLVNPEALPPGTPVEPALIDATVETAPTEMQPAGAAPQTDFFIGDRPLPRRVRTLLLVSVPVMVIAALAIAATAARLHRDPGETLPLDGNPQSFAGLLEFTPYPSLRYVRDDSSGRIDVLLLAEIGKFGAERRARSFDGKFVRATGYLRERDGVRLLQLMESADALQMADAAMVPGSERLRAPVEPLIERDIKMSGEIVDSRCYLGAMKPGSGKAHKECATLCIAGGVPPLFVVPSKGGKNTYYLLTDEQGRALDARILPFVSDPIEVIGDVERRDEYLIFKIYPASIKRL